MHSRKPFTSELVIELDRIETSPNSHPRPNVPQPRQSGTFQQLCFGALLTFGVILPLITLCTEAITGICAASFFDPIPTPFHLVAVLLVPLANALALWAIRSGGTKSLRWAATLNGFAAGSAAWQTIALMLLMGAAMWGARGGMRGRLRP